MKVKRYRPAFFSGFDDEYANPDTLAELIAIPWINSWTQDEGFHRLSLADGRNVMAELDGGRKWYVCAIILDGSVDLPTWTPPQDR